MWRIVALAILLCSGAGCSNFSQAETKEWFDAPSPLITEQDAK